MHQSDTESTSPVSDTKNLFVYVKITLNFIYFFPDVKNVNVNNVSNFDTFSLTRFTINL